MIEFVLAVFVAVVCLILLLLVVAVVNTKVDMLKDEVEELRKVSSECRHIMHLLYALTNKENEKKGG